MVDSDTMLATCVQTDIASLRGVIENATTIDGKVSKENFNVLVS